MKKHKLFLQSILAIGLSLILSSVLSAQVFAATTTQSTSLGIQGEIPSLPPSRGATTAIPSNGTSFSNVPITVSGTCPSGLLIKVFSNGVFMGSAICSGGSYSLQINLFAGQNNLTVIDYDALNQAGPISNSVNVTFNNAQYAQSGTQLSLTSTYGELGAAPGSQLVWPILLSGGRGPYAISVDWGDGSPSTLYSEQSEGTFNITHTYQVSGVYKVIVKATDSNGETAILQLVGQATGAIIQTTNSSKNNTSNTASTQPKVEIWPNLVALPIILVAFWAGKQYHIRDLKLKQKTYEAAQAKSSTDNKM